MIALVDNDIKNFVTPLKWLTSETLTSNTGEDLEQWELLTAGGNEKWCTHFGKQFGRFLHNETHCYHMIQ
jgi:hypothetical protein